MTIGDDRHEVVPFDEFLERRCATASIEWIDEQLQVEGLDSAPVLQNVQRTIAARRKTDRAVSAWRKPLRMMARAVALLLGIPLAFATFDMPKSRLPWHQGKQAYLAQSDRLAPLPRITDSAREQFLSPETRPLGFDTFKEEYFRTQVPYGDIIYREARKNELSPELVAAIVHTESDFRPTLVSHKNAQGLMQIVPARAALLGVDDPFDPEKNIAAGTRYVRYLLDTFHDETIALAAYNAGEGNVARFGGIPPFEETRQYISKVNRRTHRYREGFRNSYIAAVRMRTDVAHR
jgi:soluble lytic murein transglycosylase-like protein